MKYCKNCLSTNLRPNAEIRDGLCLPCYFQNNLSPKPNRIKLLELREKYRVSRIGQKNKGAYDCIVGVSGGKDSTRQAQWVRDRLGLRPLLICVAYPPKQMSEIGAKNLSNIIEMVNKVRDTEKMLGKISYEISEKVKKNKKFARSLFIVKDVKKGEVLNANNVRSIRPGYGLHPKNYYGVLGKKFNEDYEKGTALSFDYFKE